MRIVLTAYAEKTHFFSMVPLAWALRTAGHEVRVASQPALTEAVVAAGLTAVPVGSDHQMWRVLRAKGREYRSTLAPFDRAGDAEESVTWEYMQAGYDDVVPWWIRLVNDPMVDDLVAYCRSWRPDLVVWEPTTYAGAIAALACGAAHARLTWGVDFHGAARGHYVRLREGRPGGGGRDALLEWASAVGARFGVGVDDAALQGDFTIEQLPGPLRMETGLDRVAMRFVAYNGPAVVPGWLRRPAERARVALTLGLSATEQLSGYSVSVGQVLEALAEVDAEVVATVTEREQERVGAVPANVRMLSFVPLHALLPTCRAVIHHGGWGTVCTASAAGVPQLIMPQQLDAPYMAERIAGIGAGRHLSCTSAAQVGDEVGRLLDDQSYSRGARELRELMRAMPSPNEVVGDLEKRAAR